MSPFFRRFFRRISRLPVLVAVLAAPACSETSLSSVEMVDVFTQSDTRVMADVLWVVDNSGTMAEEQNLVAGAAAGFIDALSVGQADFRIGVTTTDMSADGEAGSLVGPPDGRILSPETEDLGARFESLLRVGLYGDRNEMGLAAALSAIALGAEGEVNEGMFRPEAQRHIIFVSDEDDQSPDDVADYVDRYDDGQSERAVITALVGDMPQGCLGNLAAADAGGRYIEAARLSGGFVGSICLEDYGQVVDEVGLRVLDLRRRFVLSAPGEASTMEVRVDDVLMPKRPRDGWRYEPGDNAVVFTGYAVPGPGQVIEVRYRISQVVAG